MSDPRVITSVLSLELDAANIGWGDEIAGRVLLYPVEPHTLGLVEVRLLSFETKVSESYVRTVIQSSDGGGSSWAVSSRRWEAVPALPGQQVQLPFGLRLSWGRPFGTTAAVAVLAYPAMTRRRGFLGLMMTLPVRTSHLPQGWRLPQYAQALVEVRPPEEFQRVAAILSQVAGAPVRSWSRRLGGDGARATFDVRPQGPDPAGLHLELFRAHGVLYGDLNLLLKVRGSVLVHNERTAIRIPLNDLGSAEALFAGILRPHLSALADVPIPSSRPEPDAETLPRPAGAVLLDDGTLPIAAEAPE